MKTVRATQGIEIIDFVPGMTKREYFAAMAMQGIIANPQNNLTHLMGVNGNQDVGFIERIQASKEAIGYADELLKQLETTKPKP